MATKEPFTVIIVGAGVAGLTLANCLVKADIDFVVLDKGIVAPAFGNTFTLFPQGIRILHQLGCLDAVKAECAPMANSYSRGPNGKAFVECEYFAVVKKWLGPLTRACGNL